MKKLSKLRMIELPKASILDEEEMADLLGGGCSGRCSGYEDNSEDCSGDCSGYKKN